MFNAYLHITHLQAENAELLKRIEQLEREKEALLTDLRATDPCDNCKHCGTAWECDGDCSFCDHSETCPCRECDDDSHWEWAGIKEDNPNHSPFPQGMTQAEWLGIAKEDNQ